jgi:tetratricopeptide (TPR) repeat protein
MPIRRGADEALAPIQSLVSGNPDVPDYKAALIDVLIRLGIEYSMTDELEKSSDARKQALSLSRDMAESEPNNPDIQADIAYCLGSLGDLERRMEHPSEAIAYYEEAINLLKQMLQTYPDRTSFQDQLDQNEEELQAIRAP